jgi:NTE family protein
MSHFEQISRSIQVFFRQLNGAPGTPKTAAPAPPLTLGVALGGGFARGMVHIGVLKVLEEAKIPIAAIAGTSSGSIMGAGFCSGISPAELAEIGRRLRFKDVARWTLDRGGFCSNDRLGALLERTCPSKKFADLRTPLLVVATELISGKPAIFREGNILEAVRASCAYPGMFTPVLINGVLHVDGMLSYEVPTTPLKQMGIDCVLGVHLQSSWSGTAGPRHFFDVIGQCFAIAQTRMSLNWVNDADMLLKPNVGGFAFDDFSRADELIAIGEESMRAGLPELKQKLGIVETKEPVATIQVAATQAAPLTAVSSKAASVTVARPPATKAPAVGALA